jgi:hypothetical protein
MKNILLFLLLVWQFPQSIVAVLLRFYLKLTKHDLCKYIYMDRVIYSVIRKSRNPSKFAVSFGEYIFTDHPGDTTIAHEYGHSRQSRYLGPLYLFTVGIVSVFWNLLARKNDYINRTYYQRWPENWADKLGNVKRT